MAKAHVRIASDQLSDLLSNYSELSPLEYMELLDVLDAYIDNAIEALREESPEEF